MDTATVNLIVEAISARIGATAFWATIASGLVVAVLGAIAAGGAAFLGSYLRKRGENLATKDDFDELKRQLAQNTETVETIKSDIAQRDWLARERNTIRRTMLEKLVTNAIGAFAFVDRAHLEMWANAVSTEPNPWNEGRALALLYFPELSDAISKFSHAFYSLNQCIIESKAEILANNLGNRLKPDQMLAKNSEFNVNILAARQQLFVAQNELLSLAQVLVNELLPGEPNTMFMIPSVAQGGAVTVS